MADTTSDATDYIATIFPNVPGRWRRVKRKKTVQGTQREFKHSKNCWHLRVDYITATDSFQLAPYRIPPDGTLDPLLDGADDEALQDDDDAVRDYLTGRCIFYYPPMPYEEILAPDGENQGLGFSFGPEANYGDGGCLADSASLYNWMQFALTPFLIANNFDLEIGASENEHYLYFPAGLDDAQKTQALHMLKAEIETQLSAAGVTLVVGET